MSGQYDTIESAVAGLIAEGIQENLKIDGDRACQASAGIEFGAPVMGYIGDDEECYPVILDTAKILFDADFDGTDALSITVNGVETATVTYSGSHGNTMDLIVAAIGALTDVDVYEAATAEDATNRTIYIRTKATTAVVSVTEKVATIPGSTITYETDQVFLGIATFSQKNLSTAGSAKYEQYENPNIVANGVVWALSTGTISDLQALYMSVTSGATLGRQTATAGKSVATKARSANDTVQTSTTITKIEVNGRYKPYSEKTWA